MHTSAVDPCDVSNNNGNRDLSSINGSVTTGSNRVSSNHSSGIDDRNITGGGVTIAERMDYASRYDTGTSSSSNSDSNNSNNGSGSDADKNTLHFGRSHINPNGPSNSNDNANISSTSSNSKTNSSSSSNTTAVKRSRGRPPGSTNKSTYGKSQSSIHVSVNNRVEASAAEMGEVVKRRRGRPPNRRTNINLVNNNNSGSMNSNSGSGGSSSSTTTITTNENHSNRKVSVIPSVKKPGGRAKKNSSALLGPPSEWHCKELSSIAESLFNLGRIPPNRTNDSCRGENHNDDDDENDDENDDDDDEDNDNDDDDSKILLTNTGFSCASIVSSTPLQKMLLPTTDTQCINDHINHNINNNINSIINSNISNNINSNDNNTASLKRARGRPRTKPIIKENEGFKRPRGRPRKSEPFSEGGGRVNVKPEIITENTNSCNYNDSERFKCEDYDNNGITNSGSCIRVKKRGRPPNLMPPFKGNKVDRGRPRRNGESYLLIPPADLIKPSLLPAVPDPLING